MRLVSLEIFSISRPIKLPKATTLRHGAFLHNEYRRSFLQQSLFSGNYQGPLAKYTVLDKMSRVKDTVSLHHGHTDNKKAVK